MNSAMWWMEWKAAAIRRTDGRWRHAHESRLAKAIHNRWKAQIAYLLAELKPLFPSENTKGWHRIETKALNDELKRIMDSLPQQTEIVGELKRGATYGMLKGAGRLISDAKLGKLGISFNVKHPDAVKYLSGLESLHLSDRYGSISATTNKIVRYYIRDAVETGESYSSLAKAITQLGKEGVFSPARAEMIAVNQMGNAYEEGKAIVAQEAQSIVGENMMAFWQTVDDDRVTEECAANEDAGWLPMGVPFPSGDTQAPRAGNPRCRCAIRYDFESTLRATGELK
jgi:hypothetical protein